MADFTVAKTILEQMGGQRRLMMMTGAKQFLADEKSVQFKVGKNAKGIGAVRITLLPSDTYSMAFLNSRGNLIEEINDVYCDRLMDIFETQTGLYLTFAPRRNT